VVLLDLIAASLVCWRAPCYLDWMQTRHRRRLLWVMRDELVAGLAVAPMAVLASALIGGAAIWVAVLAGVGVANALTLYGANAMLRKA
jgi:hypothetical protein